MAMTKEGLSAKLKTEIEVAFGGAATTPAWLQRFCDAVGKSVVEYVQQNADMVFQAGDIPVPNGGFVSTTPGNPIAGSSANGAATVSGGIK